MGLNIGLHEDLNSVGIQQLWIIKKSGLCVLHLNFTRKETIDESLVGGFFSVITTLINSAEDDLEVITLKSANVYYKNVNDLDFSIVLATNRNTKKKFIKKIGRANASVLPYCISIEDSKATALAAKYYLAISYPLLSMGEFMTISTVPGAIKQDLTKAFKQVKKVGPVEGVETAR